MKIVFEILQYIGPFVGVFIGWYLSRRSENRKIQYDEKKKVNHTLFLLLEIRTELTNIVKEDKFLRTYIDKIKLKLNVAEPTIEERATLKRFMKNLNHKMKSDNQISIIANQFTVCVRNLSEINPLLAHRINGKQHLSKYIEDWEEQTEQTLSLEDFNQAEEMLKFFKPKIINELEIDINEIILKVAELTDDDQTIKGAIELIERKFEEECEKDVANLVDKMFDSDYIKNNLNNQA